MTIVHHFVDGGYIVRNGATVDICVGSGPGGLPMVVSFEGEALAALAAAAMAAFRARGLSPTEAVRAAAEGHVARGLLRAAKRMNQRLGRAEMDARRWAETLPAVDDRTAARVAVGRKDG